MKFCGLDVGTSGIKAVVFDEKGLQYASSFRAYDLKLKSDGTRTLDANDIWEKAKIVLSEAAAQTGEPIVALAVSSFGESFVCVDKDDNILNEVMIYTDRRGEEEYYEAMKKSSDAEIAKICGLPPSPTYSISKILYIKKHRGEVYEKTKHMLLIQDFMNYKLTGRAVGDYSVACRTMLFDVHNLEWSDTLIKKFEIDKEKLSETVATGTIIGNVLPNIAKEIGLNENLKVVAGGHDQPMGAIGSGLRKSSTVYSMGTSGCATPVFDDAIKTGVTLKHNFVSEPMWKAGKYCTMFYNPSAGLAVKWFFDVYASEYEKAPYPLFEKNMPKTPTKIFVQPYLMGSGPPTNNHIDRFAIVGMDVGTTRYDIYKAILEGIELDQRLAFDICEKEGICITSVIGVGGGAKSVPWLQTKADIMQIPIHTLKCSEAGALGCVIACAYALGCYTTMEEAGAVMSQIEKTIEPNIANKDFYDEKFEVFKNLQASILPYSDFATR